MDNIYDTDGEAFPPPGGGGGKAALSAHDIYRPFTRYCRLSNYILSYHKVIAQQWGVYVRIFRPC